MDVEPLDVTDLPWQAMADNAVFDTLNEGIVVMDSRGRFVYVNPAATRLMGITADDFVARTVDSDDDGWEVRRPNGEPWPLEDLPITRAASDGHVTTDALLDLRHPEGRRMWVMVNARPLEVGGVRVGAVATMRDVTAERQAAITAGENQQQLVDALFASRLAVASSDADGFVLRANDHFGRLVGRSPTDLVGLHFTSFSGPDALGEQLDAVDRIARGLADQFEVHKTYVRPDGSVRHGLMNLLAIRGPGGETLQHVSIVHDVSERLQTENRLTNVAQTDELTGLLNRRGLFDRLDGLLLSPVGGLVCAFVDIDGFKGINDEFGHAEGDRVLRELGGSIRRRIRVGDDAARLGGDEFVVLFPGAPEAALPRLEEVLGQAITAVVRPDGRPVEASIGLAVAESTDLAADLLSRADLAMYRTKHERHRLRAGTVARPTVPQSDSSPPTDEPISHG